MIDGAPHLVDPRIGAEVDRYSIVRLLGKGGMGAVYEARHTRLARRVAIKFLLPELASHAEILRRFENEAVAAGGLEHPNLVAVIDVGRAADGSPYLVMEFLDGEDCARLLRRVGPLPVPRAVNVVLQACRGVAVAHAAGIVHRDLKPENLFLTDGGDGGDQIKVLDFGIAKLRPVDGQAATRTGSTFGTTYYMSPEQARGAADIDPRTDVWSLGVVLYELIGGRRPFDGDQPLNVVHQILNATPPSLDTLRTGLPRGLVAAIDTALRKAPDERFPTVRDMAAALAPFASRPVSARHGERATATTWESPAATGEPPVRRRSRGAHVGTALALAGVVGVGIVAIASLRTRGKSTASVVASPAVGPAELVVSTKLPGEPLTKPPAEPLTARLVAPVEAAAAVSGQSEQSGRARPLAVTPSGRRPRGTDGHRGEQELATPKAHAEAAAPRSAIKLDPNPY